MAKNNDWKERLGMVFSTNPDFQFEQEEVQEEETLPNAQQKLHVFFERAGRNGKVVTIVEHFVGKESDFKELGKMLKNALGIGGTYKDGQIILQGNHVERVKTILKDRGYRL